jgi:hypothetical protein
MEQDKDTKFYQTQYNSIDVLPKDLIKLIIEYSPHGQWFRLSKELSALASQVISPLNCRTSENGALYWALTNQRKGSLALQDLLYLQYNRNTSYRKKY